MKDEIDESLISKGYMREDGAGNRELTDKGKGYLRGLFKKPAYATIAFKEIDSYPIEKKRKVVNKIKKFLEGWE
ncbi:MAG: hypothetical protein ACOCTT_00755 [archaeon]